MHRSDDGSPSLTDVQYEALCQGVGRGESLLISAPTSTGKTLIGAWGLFSWLRAGYDHKAVYLVTHKALARQKFEELKLLLKDTCFSGDAKCIVLANGDTVEDGEGGVPSEPLNSPVMIATYEKYLGMLSGLGVRHSLQTSAIVCDEIQIIGDEHRGRNVEILLTILRQSAWGQIIGLSAVLGSSDAQALADWIGVKLVRLPQREKHLRYECRTPTKVMLYDTKEDMTGITESPKLPKVGFTSDAMIDQIVAETGNLPLVVFCSAKARVYEGAARLAKQLSGKALNVPGVTLTGESTTASEELASYASVKVGYHTADLTEEERAFVEAGISNGSLDVVFATSTLAAGVNFPFKTAIFDSWKRWDRAAGLYKPIPTSEFQNMAGRVGRMGFDSDFGRVLISATDGFQDKVSRQYLQPDIISPLTEQLTPDAFGQVILHLLSAKVCDTAEEIDEFLMSTFSATREMHRNSAGNDHWQVAVREALSDLEQWGYVL